VRTLRKKNDTSLGWMPGKAGESAAQSIRTLATSVEEQYEKQEPASACRIRRP
jgi:hypothetical protein